ncbi:hypothetical protein ATANTOWER_003762 [Ataeniobius toweri]|uniref:Uncharacterized protein n=1 Tax=Ataeniobius toweri TaxID=208326 RepID=A0ABU7A9N5_9TELE|nr:hypothetical protein [Ataeniobius toweri]
MAFIYFLTVGRQERGVERWEDIRQMSLGLGLEPGTAASRTVASAYGCVLNPYTISAAPPTIFLRAKSTGVKFLVCLYKLGNKADSDFKCDHSVELVPGLTHVGFSLLSPIFPFVFTYRRMFGFGTSGSCLCFFLLFALEQN